ncbi:MAG: N-acetyltransferase [Chloroflexota bacterium]|nr:GNAT family N-acetyltransferase [Caldilinea sp.]GIK75662.1 MAG: N-acetyltransferase [Chloroflexota bacterium]
MAVTIELASPLLPEVSELIRESDAVAQALYPAESNHLVGVDSLAQPHMIFCVARLDGGIVGCGAAVLKPEGYAEIKRMFVREAVRGHGVGRQILAFLEDQVRRRAVTLTRLETGVYSYDAIRLYERMGYVKIGPFADYWDDPLSVFYEKQL